MFPKKTIILVAVFLILVIGFSNKIFATSNNVTIEIYQDLSKLLISNNPNSLTIENNKVFILNNDSEKIKLFDLSESATDVFITLIDNTNKLLVYKNGKKVDSLSLKNIDLDSLIKNLQISSDKEEITSLKIYGYILSPKRVLKNYLNLTKNDTDKYFKEKIVSDNNLKLYYSGSNIDGMDTFATNSTMLTSWKNLSGNNNGTLSNFAFTPASGWDGNNIYSNPSKLTFDGVNDYVQNAAPFNFSNSTPFTVEFWINAVNQFDHRIVFSCIKDFFSFVRILISGFEDLWVNIEAPGNDIFVFGPQFPYNIWTHVAVTYDGSSMTSGVKIYFNGNLQNSFTGISTNVDSFTTSNAPFRFGVPQSSGYGFQGSLGDARVYNKALSQTEILQNFRSEQAKYYEAPSIASLSPADSSTTNVQTNLGITFNQIISKGTGNIRITKANTGEVVETINVTSDRVTLSGKTATINPVSNLARNTTYTIEVDENTFKYNGVGFAGISDRNTWNFLTTNDGTQSKVTAFSPENGSQDVPVATDLILTFDQTIYPGTGSINIFDTDDGTDLIETINVNSTAVTGAGTNMITINPSMNFSSDTSYLVAFDTTAFQNGTGINSKTIDIWEFLTVDTTPISVTSFSPSDDATSVPTNENLQIKFNKPVTVNAGNITIKKLSDNSTIETISVTGELVTGSGTDTITINPSMDFAESTAYYINIAANTFKDTSGNSYSGITNNVTWNFKTADITAPTIMTLSPTDGSSNVNVNSDFIIVFSEPVQVNTGNITITKLTAEVIPPVETISVTGSLVTGSGTDTITINPSMNLEEDIRYYINIDSTAFTDLSGNTFAGISNRSTWDFRTNDVTAPTITTLLPNNNSTDVNINSDLQILFSEIVYPKQGSINIFNSAGNVLVESINVTSNAVIGGGTNSIIINPTMSFAENTNYFITIAQGAFADFYNNQFTGILNNTIWNFKTVVPENFGGGNVGDGNNGEGNTGDGNNGGSCNFTQCEQLCCINGCCPSDPTTCIDFPNCLESSSSSGSSSISSSSSGFNVNPLISSSSSGSLIFNSDGSLPVASSSPVTIVGPETVKLNKNKISFTVSHSNVQGVVNCSIAPTGQLKILSKPKNISFTPTKNKVKVNLKISPKERKKAKKDADKRNLQLKIICDDGEGNLDIKLEPKIKKK